MTEYKVQFDFTTVSGDKFTGRSGEVYINTGKPIEEIDYKDDELIHLCASEMKRLKPKWNIFMLTIKNISATT